MLLGKLLGKHESTIRRELKRGMVEHLKTDLSTIWEYSAEYAQIDAEEKVKDKGPPPKSGKHHALVERIAVLILAQEYSPYAVPQKLAKDTAWPPGLRICEKTLYNWIKAGGDNREPAKERKDETHYRSGEQEEACERRVRYPVHREASEGGPQQAGSRTLGRRYGLQHKEWVEGMPADPCGTEHEDGADHQDTGQECQVREGCIRQVGETAWKPLVPYDIPLGHRGQRQ